MAINRESFFSYVRDRPFRGRLTQNQVDGLNVLLDEWDIRQLSDTRWLAYILATAYHETAHTMQPIREYGRGRGRRYGRPDKHTRQTYYGRGYVQLTWKENYKRAGDKLGVDLVYHPEIALYPDVAAAIIFEGMIGGWFTGKSLGNYINERTDYRNARRIVNGMDRADLIARYAGQFQQALEITSSDIPPQEAPKVNKFFNTVKDTAVKTAIKSFLPIDPFKRD